MLINVLTLGVAQEKARALLAALGRVARAADKVAVGSVVVRVAAVAGEGARVAPVEAEVGIGSSPSMTS